MMSSNNVPMPTRTILYLTQKCNMYCQHCWVGASPDAPGPSLSDAIPNIAKLLHAFKSLGVEAVGITGGEPLLLRSFVHELVEECSRLALPVGIETNGFLLTESDIHLFRECEVSVAISLDTLEETAFDSFRGLKGAFRRVQDNLQRLVAHGVRTQVIFSVTPMNVDETARFAHYMLDICGVSSLKYNVVTPMGRGKALIEDSAEWVKMIQHVVQVCQTCQHTHPARVFINVPPALVDDPSLSHTCEYKRVISVLPDATISFCGIGIRFPELVAGSLEDCLEELWHNAPLFDAIRKIGPESVNGVCTQCMFGKICCNHCPAAVYESYGDFYHSHPWCQMFYELGLFPRKFLIDVL